MIRAVFFSIFDVHEGFNLLLSLPTFLLIFSDRAQGLASGTRRLYCPFHWLFSDPSIRLPICLFVHHTSTRVLLQTYNFLHPTTSYPLPSCLPSFVKLPSQCLHVFHCSCSGRLNALCFLCYCHTQAGLAAADPRGAVSLPIAGCLCTQYWKSLCAL